MLLAMHIPDSYLSPVVCAVTWGLAAVGLFWSLRQLNGTLGSRMVPLMGVTAAGIFAGQMVNFPLVGLSTSGHLMGGVLAAVVLGPWGAVAALATVLTVQALLFADGGLTTLGANICNMGLVGGALGYAIYAPLRRALGGGERGTVLAAVLASWLIIPVSALAFVVEFAAGGAVKIFPLATWMLFYHVLIGLGEAILTGLVVRWLVRTRPDLIYDRAQGPGPLVRAGQATVAALVSAVAVAVLLAPWASQYEDGLERVAEQLGFAEQATAWSWSPFPDYAFSEGAADAPAPTGLWAHAGLVTSLMGLIGTLATFGFGVVVAGFARLRPVRTAERAT